MGIKSAPFGLLPMLHHAWWKEKKTIRTLLLQNPNNNAERHFWTLGEFLQIQVSSYPVLKKRVKQKSTYIATLECYPVMNYNDFSLPYIENQVGLLVLGDVVWYFVLFICFFVYLFKQFLFSRWPEWFVK